LRDTPNTVAMVITLYSLGNKWFKNTSYTVAVYFTPELQGKKCFKDIPNKVAVVIALYSQGNISLRDIAIVIMYSQFARNAKSI